MGLAVVAVGGHSLATPGDLERLSRELATLAARGWGLVVTHGSGPQVGERLLEEPTADPGAGSSSLDVLDAETQGTLGYRLQQALGNALRQAGQSRLVATILTQVVVDEADPAFTRPTKPVGPFYDAREAERLRREHGFEVVADAGRGFRRVVASPRPLEIVEWPVVQAVLRSGALAVTAGGGGIPVVRHADGTLQGRDAVVDKDHTSSLLARRLDADVLVILTAVPEVRLGFGTPAERPVTRLTVAEARDLLAAGEFPPGSMGPKVEAAASFAAATGRPAIIASTGHLEAALRGEAGTRIEA